MKKLMVTMMAMGVLLSATACGGKDKGKSTVNKSQKIEQTQKTVKTEKPDLNVQIPNPWTEHKSVEAAKEVVGFDFSAPESIEKYEKRKILTMGDTIFQLIYYTADENAGITLRKYKGAEDQSGNFNEYKEVKELTVGEKKVTVKGNAGKIFLAFWSVGNMGFSIDLSDGVSENVLTGIVEKMA